MISVSSYTSASVGVSIVIPMMQSSSSRSSSASVRGRLSQELRLVADAELHGTARVVERSGAHDAPSLFVVVEVLIDRVEFQFAISENESKSKKKRDFKSIDCAKLKWC